MKNISLCIEKKDDLSEKYNDMVLANEISNYIESECLSLKKKDEVVIDIITEEELSLNDKREIEVLIRNNYKELQKEKMIVKEYQNRQSIFLSLFGILFIIISNILNEESILSELFLIVGWVALWEVIYDILFDNIKDKIKLAKYKKLANSKINFITKKKP